MQARDTKSWEWSGRLAVAFYLWPRRALGCHDAHAISPAPTGPSLCVARRALRCAGCLPACFSLAYRRAIRAVANRGPWSRARKRPESRRVVLRALLSAPPSLTLHLHRRSEKRQRSTAYICNHLHGCSATRSKPCFDPRDLSTTSGDAAGYPCATKLCPEGVVTTAVNEGPGPVAVVSPAGLLCSISAPPALER
jgi:hypothetical protein